MGANLKRGADVSSSKANKNRITLEEADACHSHAFDSVDPGSSISNQWFELFTNRLLPRHKQCPATSTDEEAISGMMCGNGAAEYGPAEVQHINEYPVPRAFGPTRIDKLQTSSGTGRSGAHLASEIGTRVDRRRPSLEYGHRHAFEATMLIEDKENLSDEQCRVGNITATGIDIARDPSFMPSSAQQDQAGADEAYTYPRRSDYANAPRARQWSTLPLTVSHISKTG